MRVDQEKVVDALTQPYRSHGGGQSRHRARAEGIVPPSGVYTRGHEGLEAVRSLSDQPSGTTRLICSSSIRRCPGLKRWRVNSGAGLRRGWPSESVDPNGSLNFPAKLNASGMVHHSRGGRQSPESSHDYGGVGGRGGGTDPTTSDARP